MPHTLIQNTKDKIILCLHLVCFSVCYFYIFEQNMCFQISRGWVVFLLPHEHHVCELLNPVYRLSVCMFSRSENNIWLFVYQLEIKLTVTMSCRCKQLTPNDELSFDTKSSVICHLDLYMQGICVCVCVHLCVSLPSRPDSTLTGGVMAF